MVATVAAVWIPLAAEFSPANEAAPALIAELPHDTRYLLGDKHYNAPNVRQAWESFDRFLLVPQFGPYPHTGTGKEVRRIFHRLRSTAIENFEQFVVSSG